MLRDTMKIFFQHLEAERRIQELKEELAAETAKHKKIIKASEGPLQHMRVKIVRSNLIRDYKKPVEQLTFAQKNILAELGNYYINKNRSYYIPQLILGQLNEQEKELLEYALNWNIKYARQNNRSDILEYLEPLIKFRKSKSCPDFNFFKLPNLLGDSDTKTPKFERRKSI